MSCSGDERLAHPAHDVGTLTAALLSMEEKMRTSLAVTIVWMGSACAPIPQPPTAPVRIVSVGSSFGECVGPCQQTLLFDTDVTLIIEDWTSQDPPTEQLGALTRAGRDELSRIEGTLDPGALDETYGCPDCADGGAMHLVLDQLGDLTEHHWEYSAPPADLADVDALFHDLRGALIDCVSSTWIDPDPACVAFVWP